LHEWLFACTTVGPPVDSLSVGDPQDEKYRSPIPGTGLTVDYLAIVHERLMILKSIGLS
jgi:hypothetical protein